MKLSKNRNVKIISRPCWCPHQHAHTGPALRALPPRSPSPPVLVSSPTRSRRARNTIPPAVHREERSDLTE